MMTDPGQWIEGWLSTLRFAVYLDAAGGDRGRALALYEWNARAAAAFHHDLGHLEVALRNAYDRALRHRDESEARHWVFDPSRHFPIQEERARNGVVVDANDKPRAQIEQAIRSARRDTKGRAPTPPGKVIAELRFGFWRYLTIARRTDALRIPYLRTAFRPGTDRRDVDHPVGRLHLLRNRVAHNEPLIRMDLAGRHADVLTVAGLMAVPLRDHLTDLSPVQAVLKEWPAYLTR
ncbi:hypothetical protein WIS52_20485 [Pseudonocardia nematodicida]|uniref:Abi-like protein n=1 Tax=Pseudonocardia nematodicida TaxID=1206997 RepID=A0ABV1KEF8_9PSEU